MNMIPNKLPKDASGKEDEQRMETGRGTWGPTASAKFSLKKTKANVTKC